MMTRTDPGEDQTQAARAESRSAARPGVPPGRTAPRSIQLLALTVPLLLLAVVWGAAPSASAEDGEGGYGVSGRWSVHANADHIQALARDADTIWVGSAGGGVARWSADGRWIRQYTAPDDGLPCNEVRDIVRWREAWFFATCDGLAVWDAAADRMAAVTADLRSSSVTALAVDDRDRLWVATEPTWSNSTRAPGAEQPGGWIGGGVAVTDDGVTYRAYRRADGLPSNDIRDVALWRGQLWVAARPSPEWNPPGEDPDGNPEPGRWVSEGGGVGRLTDGGWLSMDGEQSSELTSDARVLAPADDALWLGTGGRGLVAWNGAAWHGLRDCGNPSRCIPDNYVSALAVGGDGAIWVATERFNGYGTGVAVLDDRGTPTEPDDDAWFALRGQSSPPGGLVQAILPDADASVWMGVARRDAAGNVHGLGLAHLLDDRQTMRVHRHVDTVDGAPADNHITSVAADPRSGDIWVGTEGGGVSVLSPDGRWHHHTVASTGGALGSDDIADILVTPDGAVWVATRQRSYDADARRWIDGGLSRFRDGGWKRFTADQHGLPSDHLSSLALDADGTLWIGTGATDRGPKELAYAGRGLAAFDPVQERWLRTYTHPQLAGNTVTDLAVRAGNLWVATAYFRYVDPRPGGAQITVGGGVSILDIGAGAWRSLTPDDGLTPALRDRGGRALADLRGLWLPPSGDGWVAGLAFEGARFERDATPGGFVDRVGQDARSVKTFSSEGPVTTITGDAPDTVWVGTAEGGLHVRFPDGRWQQSGPLARGRIARRVSVVERFEDGLWMGSRGGGLAVLRPTDPDAPGSGNPDPGPTTTPGPSPTPDGAASVGTGLIWRLGPSIYLPSVKREFHPQVIKRGDRLPSPPNGPVR